MRGHVSAAITLRRYFTILIKLLQETIADQIRRCLKLGGFDKTPLPVIPAFDQGGKLRYQGLFAGHVIRMVEVVPTGYGSSGCAHCDVTPENVCSFGP